MQRIFSLFLCIYLLKVQKSWLAHLDKPNPLAEPSCLPGAFTLFSTGIDKSYHGVGKVCF
jgi:hypothetical protein